MSPRSDPAALRWLIGVELANYRAETGMTLSEAAIATGISRPKLGHMETGRYQQNPEDVAKALKSYEIADNDISRVVSMTGNSGRRAWWSSWNDIVAPWLRLYLGLEGMAESLFAYDPNVIKGLFQTEEYASALTNGTERARADRVERFVGLRRARATRLTDPLPLKVEAVVGEAGLRLAVGSPKLRRAQYAHLLELAALDNVIIRVVRPEDGYHQALPGHFSILNFTAARSISYVELQDDAVYQSAPAKVWPYRAAADSLRRVAMSASDSTAFIRSLLD
jgi:transcriptional regulator with XRE-family HTH domain